MNSNATNKIRTGPKRVRTREPEDEQETQKSPPSSTPSSPTKAAKDALELAVASLPTSLQPLILHFGNKIITARCKRYAKQSIMQRMEDDTSYVPRSAKSTEFKITLSAGAKEDEVRVSFLEQQVQQAKDSYESSLKTVIEECIALEMQATKKEESQLIMDLFPAIGKAIQKLQGTDCNKHLQTLNALKMMPNLLQYGPIDNINNFLMFYQTHHSLNDVPNPTIRTMEDEYQTLEEQTNAMHLHTISLQRTENKGIQLYTKCLESIMITPTTSYYKQVEENQRLLNLKKLSNEIILGKSTEDTAMELDKEGAANYEQLKDLIRKECDKRDRKYAQLEVKYNTLEQHMKNKDVPKNMTPRSRPQNVDRTGASTKNKSVPQTKKQNRGNNTKNSTSGNKDLTKRKRSENQRKAVEKNSDTWQNNKNKMPPSSLNKSTRKQNRSIGKKQTLRNPSRKN